jgi:hypothetical protein
MIVTLGKRANRQSAGIIYNDAILRAETTRTISRRGFIIIAALAIDQMGAKPLPLATSTRRWA